MFVDVTLYNLPLLTDLISEMMVAMIHTTATNCNLHEISEHEHIIFHAVSTRFCPLIFIRVLRK